MQSACTRTAPPWPFSSLDKGGEWGTDIAKLSGFLDVIIERHEGRTMAQCFQLPRCHPVDPEDDALNPEARNRLNVRNTLAQLDLGGRCGRIWGHTRHNIFCVLWIDEKHEVWPCSD